MLRQVAAALVLASTFVACPSSSFRDQSCPSEIVLESDCVLQLSRGGGLRLPAGALVTSLGSNPDGRHIVLEDSTVVEVWITEAPADGLATTGGVGVDSTWRSDTTIAGLPATLTTFRLVSPSAAPEYGGLGFVAVDSQTAINFSVSTATPSSRDGALRRIAASISPAVR